MVSRKKGLAVLAGGLTLAAAMPAFAIEHEFGGWFRAQYINSNFSGSSIPGEDSLPDGRPFPGDQAFGFFNPTDAPRKPATANFIEQRTRIKYNAKVNPNLKVVTQFEIDYRFWGDTSYDTGRNRGAAIGSDSVNIETKHAYFEANLTPHPVQVRVGIQGLDDSLKGIFVSSDMAGALATYSANEGKTSVSAGFFRWNDDAFFHRGDDDPIKRVPGKERRDFFVIDAKHAYSDKMKVGASYYLVHAQDTEIFDFNGGELEEDLTVNVLGLNADATFGKVNVSGFVAGQFGKDDTLDRKIRAFAANLGAKAAVGSKGTARMELLYVSGDSNPSDGDGTLNSWYTPRVFDLSESGYYHNEMVILGRDKYAMTTDKSIVYDVNNLDEGVMGAFFGYDHVFTDKFMTSTNLGFAAVAKKNDNRTPEENSKYLGTEVNMEGNYKVMDNFNLTLRGAYVFLGDYFEGVTEEGRDPKDLYDLRLVAQVNF